MSARKMITFKVEDNTEMISGRRWHCVTMKEDYGGHVKVSILAYVVVREDADFICNALTKREELESETGHQWKALPSIAMCEPVITRIKCKDLEIINNGGLSHTTTLKIEGKLVNAYQATVQFEIDKPLSVGIKFHPPLFIEEKADLPIVVRKEQK